MADDPLSNLIERLAQQSRQASMELSNSSAGGHSHASAISSGTALPVADALRAIPQMANLENQWYAVPGHSSVIIIENIAKALLDRVQYVPPDIIAKDLMRFLLERTVSVTETRLLAGITLSNTIELGDGFSIVPPEDAPKISFSPFLFSQENKPRHGWGSAPSAALVRRSEILVTITPPSSSLPPQSLNATVENDWEAALLSCALASDSAPQMRELYYTFDSPGWIDVRNNAVSGSETFPVRETHSTFFNSNVPQQVFPKLRTPPKSVRLAVNRLIASRRRVSDADTAIDLGTCLEALLMSGEKTEIGYKIATRAAWLVGKSFDERKAIYDAARRLYEDRSTAAHSGELRPTRDMIERQARRDRFKASDRLCVQVIIHVLLGGVKKPDEWTNLVLGYGL